jgi:hypothetical protein
MSEILPPFLVAWYYPEWATPERIAGKRALIPVTGRWAL